MHWDSDSCQVCCMSWVAGTLSYTLDMLHTKVTLRTRKSFTLCMAKNPLFPPVLQMIVLHMLDYIVGH